VPADERHGSGRRSRVVLTPRCWRQASEKCLACDGDNQARSPGRARYRLLKPLRAGMPGVSGEPRGDYARVVLFFPTRGCGCIAHPAFPTPSIILGKRFMHHSGVEPSRERAGAGGPSDVVVGCQTSSLRGANATRQSTLAQPRKMDCFVVSLLAMTRAFAVMAGLVPAIHVLPFHHRRTWMPGTRPGMTQEGLRREIRVSRSKFRHCER